MFTIKKQFRFEAAHKLPHHDGKCARLHGHSWVMEVEVRGATLQKTGPKQGMLADFGDLKRVVQPVVDGWLDHFYLNETLGLENPTSEEVAYWVFNKIEPAIPGLVAVHIHETCTSACCYKPDNHESKT